MYRLSTTTLESYRLFRDGDWMDFDKLKNSLETFEETPLMARGTSLHSILEAPEKYAQGADYVCNGYRWVGLENVVSAIPNGINEVKIEHIINTPGHGPVMLVAKADMLDGILVREFKTTKQFNAEKYLDSIQWRIYCMAFQSKVCIFTIFQVQGGEDWPAPEALCVVKSVHKIECFTYTGMEDDVAELLDEFLDFVGETGIRPLGLRRIEKVA
ncbi:hypothetical protein R84981_002859 [Carnimonas sp. R-84981]|uniref:hypothetical protein n=1 Tax=Carnimonas bestiolae TaxID=3402172 RepID=UPI003EDBC780